jgi:site-specific DNA-methyltransferase (adenine-specific)
MEINSLINGDCQLMFGDCLERMKDIADKSVDMVLCDLPYGVLNKSNPSAKWDSIIPFEPLWKQYKRITKPNAAIVLFSQGMFTANLMMSNPTWWRYNLVWKKGNRVSGFLNANRQPMRNHEDICVFSSGQTIYNPQFSLGKFNHNIGGGTPSKVRCYGNFTPNPTVKTNKKYPLSVLNFEKEHSKQYHPTQKPVALLEYLIKTYSNEGEMVLDNTMGSGSTGVACVNTNRKFIGIEMDENYYDISCKRIKNAIIEKEQELFKI